MEADIDERRVRIAELQARQLAAAFSAALTDVAEHLTPSARSALKVAFAQRLRSETCRGANYPTSR